MRRLLALLLLLLLPVQGMAAAVTSVLCGPAHVHEVAGDGAHHPGGNHDHGHDSEASHDGHHGSDYPGHLCCHLSASAVPVAPLSIGSGDEPILRPKSDTAFSLFDPEQPQRPPRG